MATAKITIQGQRKLTRKLNNLEPKVAKKVVRQAMRAAMKPMHATFKANLPVGETGNLKRSAKLRAARRSRKGFGIVVIATGPGVGGIEYGDSNQPPQAPGRRAFDSEADGARRRVIDLMWAGIEAEAKAKKG